MSIGSEIRFNVRGSESNGYWSSSNREQRITKRHGRRGSRRHCSFFTAARRIDRPAGRHISSDSALPQWTPTLFMRSVLVRESLNLVYVRRRAIHETYPQVGMNRDMRGNDIKRV